MEVLSQLTDIASPYMDAFGLQFEAGWDYAMENYDLFWFATLGTFAIHQVLVLGIDVQ
jgi:hypothetical protein